MYIMHYIINAFDGIIFYILCSIVSTVTYKKKSSLSMKVFAISLYLYYREGGEGDEF